jgi:hypothetical protein
VAELISRATCRTPSLAPRACHRTDRMICAPTTLTFSWHPTRSHNPPPPSLRTLLSLTDATGKSRCTPPPPPPHPHEHNELNPFTEIQVIIGLKPRPISPYNTLLHIHLMVTYNYPMRVNCLQKKWIVSQTSPQDATCKWGFVKRFARRNLSYSSFWKRTADLALSWDCERIKENCKKEFKRDLRSGLNWTRERS